MLFTPFNALGGSAATGTAGIIAREQETQVPLLVTNWLCDSGQVTSPLWVLVPSSAQLWGLDLMISSALSY